MLFIFNYLLLLLLLFTMKSTVQGFNGIVQFLSTWEKRPVTWFFFSYRRIHYIISIYAERLMNIVSIIRCVSYFLWSKSALILASRFYFSTRSCSFSSESLELFSQRQFYLFSGGCSRRRVSVSDCDRNNTAVTPDPPGPAFCDVNPDVSFSSVQVYKKQRNVLLPQCEARRVITQISEV